MFQVGMESLYSVLRQPLMAIIVGLTQAWTEEPVAVHRVNLIWAVRGIFTIPINTKRRGGAVMVPSSDLHLRALSK
jgi:hypothetical protein